MRKLPIKRDVALAYASSLLVAGLIFFVSVVSLVVGPAAIYKVDATAALGINPSVSGIIVPGFLAHDILNLVVGLPILLVCLWLARRGSLTGLLLLPGALFYVLYSYIQYLVGAPFGVLFLPYVTLVVVSAYTVIGLVASIDGEKVRGRFAATVPARIVGGVMVSLALLTLAQDGGGALATAFSGGIPIDPAALHIWIADLTLEVPAMLVGGVLLWRRETLGFAVAPALLFQFGLTPVALVVILALQPVLTAAPIDVPTIVGLLVFAAVAFLPLVYMLRGMATQWHAEPPDAEAVGSGYVDEYREGRRLA